MGSALGFGGCVQTALSCSDILHVSNLRLVTCYKDLGFHANIMVNLFMMTITALTYS